MAGLELRLHRAGYIVQDEKPEYRSYFEKDIALKIVFAEMLTRRLSPWIIPMQRHFISQV